MATKYYCDKCGKELDDEFMEIDESRLQYYKDAESISKYKFVGARDATHVLCLECYNDYLGFLNGTFIDI